jgi:CRISPR-associated exonuclease Cas4
MGKQLSSWLLEVTDLKQYLYCPRIVFYRYCLPSIRPVTVLMEEGIRSHEHEEGREERRSLHSYGVSEGERFFHLALRSERLGVTGYVDLAIATPSRSAHQAEGIVVDYKYTEQRAGMHFKLQLAAYALLIEEAWGLPVTRGFIYSTVLRRAEPIQITQPLRHKVTQAVNAIRQMIERESMPAPPPRQHRCPMCEFRRFCNDVV